jgi:hypothetical protein
MRPNDMPRPFEPDHSEEAAMGDLIERLRQQAAEIASAGHNGWGNTMTEAADELARKDAEIAAANAEIDELVRALKLCTQRAERVEARVREAPVVQVAPPYTASMHGMRGIHCVTINVIGEDAIAIGGKRVALVLLDTEEAK